jgi:hypothetical protein
MPLMLLQLLLLKQDACLIHWKTQQQRCCANGSPGVLCSSAHH